MKERYYAVRIGDPRRHQVYLAVGCDTTPLLWLTRTKAEAWARKEVEASTPCKIVRVAIEYPPVKRKKGHP